MKKNDLALDKETINFLNETYSLLINEDVNSDKVYNINFGPISYSFMAPMNSLVIGFRYDKFDENGMSDEEWKKNYDKQRELLEMLNERLKQELSKHFSCDVNVIEYNEYSIKMLKNNNEVKSIG